jgi:hypothetical protein
MKKVVDRYKIGYILGLSTEGNDMDDFETDLLKEVYTALCKRLEDVRRGLAIPVGPWDEFDSGINCRLVNEEMWLLETISKIEG